MTIAEWPEDMTDLQGNNEALVARMQAQESEEPPALNPEDMTHLHAFERPVAGRRIRRDQYLALCGMTVHTGRHSYQAALPSVDLTRSDICPECVTVYHRELEV